MIDIKKCKKILLNRIFLYVFFGTCVLSFIFYLGYSGYTYLQKKKNTEDFVILYDILQRYNLAVISHSSVPLEEIIQDINKAESNLSFFSSFRDQFLFLKSISLIQVKKDDEGLLLLKKYLNQSDWSSPLKFLYELVYAVTLAKSNEQDKKQEGLLLLKKCANQKYFRDVALFYYGYFLLKTTSLHQADEAWYPLLNDPQFNNSQYKTLVEKARNWDY